METDFDDSVDEYHKFEKGVDFVRRENCDEIDDDENSKTNRSHYI